MLPSTLVKCYVICFWYVKLLITNSHLSDRNYSQLMTTLHSGQHYTVDNTTQWTTLHSGQHYSGQHYTVDNITQWTTLHSGHNDCSKHLIYSNIHSEQDLDIKI